MSTHRISNPVLKGFNPDPSIIRVGEDYYIAVSTFEWFPGVVIYHSRNLRDWEVINRPLNSLSQIDMRGEGCSCGVWAPCLSYNDGIYYLVYSDMKTRGRVKDVHNYLVTTEDISGKWSEPVFLNSSGFDPSFFHDEGKIWLLNMDWDGRKNIRHDDRFRGILLQEYSGEQKKLVGQKKNIFTGSDAKKTEGPHLYKKDGYYYLITAEGGTGVTHQVTLARSRNIDGPYEIAPNNPILTSKGNDSSLKRSGHADIVQAVNGEWYMVHLCSRYLGKTNRSPLGRETAIQKIKWENGWIVLEDGDNTPKTFFEVGWELDDEKQKKEHIDDFDSKKLDVCYHTLRMPLDAGVLSLDERPGNLRLYGHESLKSTFCQALIARRWQSFNFMAETCIEFHPQNDKQGAGLICLYDINNYYYLKICADEMGKKMICVEIEDETDQERDDICEYLDDCERVYLKVEVKDEELMFSYSYDEENYISIGPKLDASILSDEYGETSSFTGAFVGLCCQDLNGTRLHADFDFFTYVERI